MSKPWGIGDWAAEAEREEAEEKERAAAAAAAAPLEAFPTLGEAASVKPKKKRQQQKFSLAELTIGKSVTPGSRSRTMSNSVSLTQEEMMMLPTGPRDRSSDEEHTGGLGGAFRDYRDYGRGDRDQNRGGFGGGFDRERGGGGFLRDRERDRDEPSRADESSNWSSLKKSAVSGGFDVERRRGSRLQTADRDLPSLSRADEVDNWGLAKKSLPLAAVDARRRNTFDESRQESRANEVDNWASSKKSLPLPMPHGQDPAYSRADEVDNWASSKKVAGQDPPTRHVGTDPGGRWGKRSEFFMPQATEEPQRRRLVIAPRSRQSSPPPNAGSDVENVMQAVSPRLPPSKVNPFGSARPREDILACRGPDLQEIKNQLAMREQDSRPSSSHSSRPHTPEVHSEAITRAKPRVNPFGDAKPREVLLQERGKDWRKMDFEYEHRGVDRPEMEEELLLKEEIKRLKELIGKEREAEGAQQMNGVVAADAPSDSADLNALTEELHIKEKQLEDLIRALDDRVRFSQKIGDRPGSRSGRSDAGRSYDATGRPGSRPGSGPASRSGRSDIGRSHDLPERPGSQSGRRNFDSSESPRSQSGFRAGDRWSHAAGQFDGGRELLERKGSWAPLSDSGRSFDSLQRPRRWGEAVPVEVGGGVADYSQEAAGLDGWTRTNEWSNNRRGSGMGRERFNDRGGNRRY